MHYRVDSLKENASQRSSLQSNIFLNMKTLKHRSYSETVQNTNLFVSFHVFCRLVPLALKKRLKKQATNEKIKQTQLTLRRSIKSGISMATGKLARKGDEMGSKNKKLQIAKERNYK